MEQHHGRHRTGSSPWQKAIALPRVPPVAACRRPCHLTQIMTDTLSMARAVTRHSIRAAAGRIAPHIRRTPLLRLAGADLGLPHAVTLKLELLQASGSFKPRGAFNTMLSTGLSAPLPAAGVIAASGGNHGAAVAYAARALGVRAEIFVPVLAGQGTVALEFSEDAPDLTHVLVATGGGGLIGGMAAWYAGSGTQVISV